ncbi:MAG: nucleotidyltransferase family protein [Candidatus Fimenecus sp.]
MQNVVETKEYFLSVVSAALCGTPVPTKPDAVDFADVYRLAARNAVQGLFYLAFSPCKDAVPETIFARLQKTYQLECARETAQQAFLADLRADFTAAGIAFMLLKGTHLKSLYPQPEMRFMVDMDILVHENAIENAKKILLEKGLEISFDNGKDIVFLKKPFLTVELHRSLFQEDYFMYPYFSGAWERTEKADGTEYKMPENDLYVYTLAHLAEHYLDAGSCFRPMMDLFLMEKAYENTLDFAYIDKQFSKIGIAKFAANIRRLTKAMFSGAVHDDTLFLMENYIVLGPPVENAAEASKIAATQKSKARRILETLFPNYRHMALKYPILKKRPVLLPIFWCLRIFQYAFTKNSRLTAKREQLKNVDQKSADTMQQIFKKSGL